MIALFSPPRLGAGDHHPWPLPGAGDHQRERREERMSRVLAALGVAILAAISSFAQAEFAQAEPLKVAISQRGFWDSSFVEFAETAGFFKEANLEIEPFYTDGGAATLTTVLSGSADIGLSNGLLGVIGAYVKGAPVRVISAQMTGANELYWYARAESGIRSLKDAAGKT